MESPQTAGVLELKHQIQKPDLLSTAFPQPAHILQNCRLSTNSLLRLVAAQLHTFIYDFIIQKLEKESQPQKPSFQEEQMQGNCGWDCATFNQRKRRGSHSFCQTVTERVPTVKTVHLRRADARKLRLGLCYDGFERTQGMNEVRIFLLTSLSVNYS